MADARTFPAITIWQPWASLIAAGAKPYEFRRWAAPSAYVGRRIAIHAGARPAKNVEILDLQQQIQRGEPGAALVPGLALDVLDRAGPRSMPHSAVLCIATLGRPRKATALFAGPDSDRIDHHVWAWPLTDIVVLEPYQPATGAQGFWTWTPPPGCEAA